MAMNFCKYLTLNSLLNTFIEYLMMRLLLQTLLITSVALLLAACAASGPSTQQDGNPEQLAERAYAQGDYRRAATYWQQAIDAGSALGADASNDLKLNTAEAWFRARESLRGAAILAEINPDTLSSRQRSQYFVVQADNAMQQNDLQMAGFYMQAAAENLPSSLKPYYADLQRNLVNLTRGPSDRSIEETAELSENLLSYDPELAVVMLQSLESVPSGQLQMMINQQQYQPGFTGWMELSLQVRTLVLSDRPVNDAARSWANSHPGHPINESNYADLVDRYRALYPVPSKVAVLLPTKGSLAGVATAIRDGIVSAYLDNPGDAELRFYAAGDSPESAVSAYMQARNDGAKQVIGPLDLESTRALSTLSSLTTSVLLLNDKASSVGMLNTIDSQGIDSPDGNGPDSNGPRGKVNSLLLSQTEEAELIAERALSLRFKRAVVFVPDTDWGARVEQAFTNTFNQGNGRVIALSRYSQSNSDQSEMLTRLLRIEESNQREAELRSWLGVPMDFEPSRRDDFDFIFMAATPAEGRELKPLLRFHDVGDVPVFAMGRVYSGQLDPTADQDLNGIVFPSTRWNLQAAQTKAGMPKSVRGGAYGSFFALGEDAWRLIPWLPLLQKDRDLMFPGQLGDLHLESDGRVSREPAWAQFNSGKPTPYQWPGAH